MSRPFHILATKYVPHLQYAPNGQCLPLYRYTDNGERIDNITDWELEQFRKHYAELGGRSSPDPPARKGREYDSLSTGTRKVGSPTPSQRDSLLATTK